MHSDGIPKLITFYSPETDLKDEKLSRRDDDDEGSYSTIIIISTTHLLVFIIAGIISLVIRSQQKQPRIACLFILFCKIQVLDESVGKISDENEGLITDISDEAEEYLKSDELSENEVVLETGRTIRESRVEKQEESQ
jgi:hypothetical protein